MKLDQLITTARDAITVKRVFAEPYEKEGVTVIAALAGAMAAVMPARRAARLDVLTALVTE